VTASIAVLGLDLSLTGTGIAEILPLNTTPGCRVHTLTPPRDKATGHDRLQWIVEAVWDTFWLHAGARAYPLVVPLVVVEGPSYGSASGTRQGGHHERAGLWWLVTHKLWTEGVDVAVVAPAALKRYATGKGNASKDQVLAAAVRRWPDIDMDNNGADALWLAAMGRDHIGHPIVRMPAANRLALDAVAWPAWPSDRADELAGVPAGMPSERKPQ